MRPLNLQQGHPEPATARPASSHLEGDLDDERLPAQREGDARHEATQARHRIGWGIRKKVGS